MRREYIASLTAPSGATEVYRVQAANKAEARKLVAALYRRDTPPPSAGFYSFSQQRLRWVEGEE